MGDVVAAPAELTNFRDIGGAPVVGGGRVRRGVVYRSDGLHVLDPDACRSLTADLGLRTVVDLRSEFEVERTGRFEAIDGGPRLVRVPILDGSFVEQARSATLDLASMYAHMSFMAGRQIGQVIDHVLFAENLPTVLFCTAGKDRTGVVVALVLAVLGVEDEHIVADYAASAPAMDAVFARFSADLEPGDLPAVPDGMLDAPPEVMARLLRSIRSRHGSVASYLASIGVDEAAAGRLRRLLVDS